LKVGLFDAEQIFDIPADIHAIAEQRRQAKLAKDRATADLLREKLTDAGWAMQDEKDSYQLQKL
jgi:cysteinyl-tRNA synthetase